MTLKERLRYHVTGAIERGEAVAIAEKPSPEVKLERLLRYHRQRVFDHNGALHTRALHRLKRTRTFAAMAQRNREAAVIRAGERLTGMGY